MEHPLGDALAGFDAALARLREGLSRDSALYAAVFDGAGAWTDLLAYKLVPHLAGEGCLVAAVAGGTNSGKSTVFNLLLGREVSPVVATAAATRRPLLAANAQRRAECLEGKLVPEFQPLPLSQPQSVVDNESPADALYVAEAPGLPSRLVLLDTPDVDSIDRANWAVAESIRAAGDLLIAVVTGEKYKDDRVVSFFREARASGRVVVPVMNKANPESDFAVARRQLDEFRAELDLDGPAFAVPHDFDLAATFQAPVLPLNDTPPLREYLDTLDVPAIKERVYSASIAHFAQEAGAFLRRTAAVGEVLSEIVHEFEARAHDYAGRYDPAPGAAVGGLFHEFVQSRRGPVRRAIGVTSVSVAKTAGAVGRRLRGALQRRTTLDAGPEPVKQSELRAERARQVESIARDLAASYIKSIANVRELVAHLLEDAASKLDTAGAVNAVVADTVRSDNITEEFRQHARQVLESWWNDKKGRRRVLETLDTVLAAVPTAIAAPLSIYAGGVGAPEAIAVAGPFVEQFVARVIEFQFGDAMFDFLSPWRAEQRRVLESALLAHITHPCLRGVLDLLEPLEGETMEELNKWLSQCRQA